MSKVKQLAKASVVTSVLALSGVSGTVFAVSENANTDHKVTICHATSAETNPWVRIVVDEHATAGHFDNNGTPLAGHEDDVLLEGDVACPATTTPENPGTPETPGTVLGTSTQVTTVPKGAVKAGAGSAVELSPVAVTGLAGSVVAAVAGIALNFKRRLQ